MTLLPYTEALAPLLADAWNESFGRVPHCRPITTAQWQDAMAGVSNAPPREPLDEQRGWVALEDDQVVGFCHAGLRDGPPRDDGHLHIYRPGKLGVIACFWHKPGHRRAGTELLQAAESHLCACDAPTIRAWHYDETYPFYHLEHVYLSGSLVHVEATLGLAGFEPTQGELVLEHPAWPTAACDPLPADIALVPEWHRDGLLPSLIMRAMRDDQEIGICVGTPAHSPASATASDAWLYTPWLGVAQEARRRGLGRAILLNTLEALAREGYNRAAICCIASNYPALALYTSLGYEVVDRTQVWCKYPGSTS